MLILWLYSCLFISRFLRQSMNNTLDELLTQNRKAVILFFSEENSLLDSAFSILDRAYHNDRDSATIAFFDVRRNPSNISAFPISQSPELVFFIDQQYAGSYYGDWTDNSISDTISDFIQEQKRPTELKSLAEINDFQETKPVNLILFGEYYTNLAKEFLSFFEQFPTVPIAHVSSVDLASRLGITQRPMIQLNRPLDNVHVNFEEFTVNNLKNAILPVIKPINKNQLCGNSMKTDWTLIALVDSNNKVHQQMYSDIVNQCRSVFQSMINYESCDFFTCNKLTSYSKVNNVTNPVFFMMKRYEYKNTSKPIQYQDNQINPVRIRKWVRKVISTLPNPLDIYAEENKLIPILTIDKNEFVQIINDNATDSIFLFNIKQKGESSNQQEIQNLHYDIEYLLKGKMMYTLNGLLHDTESIAFYFFVDELTQQEIQSLNLTNTIGMNFVLYSAGSKPNYKIMECSTIKLCLTSIIENVKSRLSQKTQEKVQEYLSNNVVN